MIHFGSKYEGNYNKSIVGKVELINTRTYTGTENVFEISDGSNVSVQGIDTGEYELDLYINTSSNKRRCSINPGSSFYCTCFNRNIILTIDCSRIPRRNSPK